MGGSRWWLGSLGGRGRLLWPLGEARRARLPHLHPTIPESIRAGPGGRSVSERAEAENVSGNPKDKVWPCQCVCLPSGPEDVRALALWPLCKLEPQLRWGRKWFGLRPSPELRTAGVPVLGRSSFTHWLIHSPHTTGSFLPGCPPQSVLVGFSCPVYMTRKLKYGETK